MRWRYRAVPFGCGPRGGAKRHCATSTKRFAWVRRLPSFTSSAARRCRTPVASRQQSPTSPGRFRWSRITRRRTSGAAFFTRASPSADKALADLSAALAHDPVFAQAWLRRALLHFEANRLEEAVADYSQALRADPHLHVVYARRGLAHAHLGQFKQAIDDLTIALVHDRGSPQLLYERGRALTNDGRVDEALADFTRSLELDPEFVRAYAYRAAIYRHQGRHEQALGDYFAALRLDPSYALQYVCQCGLFHAARGEYERAVGEFTVALAMDSGNVAARRWAQQARNAWEKQSQRASAGGGPEIVNGAGAPPAELMPVAPLDAVTRIAVQPRTELPVPSVVVVESKSPRRAASGAPARAVRRIEDTKKTPTPGLKVRAVAPVVEAAVELAGEATLVEEEAAQALLAPDPQEDRRADEKEHRLAAEIERLKEAPDPHPARLAIQRAIKEASVATAPSKPKRAPLRASVEDDDDQMSFLERQISFVRRRRTPLVAALVVVGLSCFFFPTSLVKAWSRPRLQPVHGQVFYLDQPVPMASVVLDPVRTKPPDFPRPHAVVGDDGSFTLSTFGHDDGAPVGEYRVIVTWFVRESGQDYEGAPAPKNKLPAKYGRFDTSGLSVRIESDHTDMPPLMLK